MCFRLNTNLKFFKVFLGEGKTNLRSIRNPTSARFRFFLYFSVAEARVNPAYVHKFLRFLTKYVLESFLMCSFECLIFLSVF